MNTANDINLYKQLEQKEIELKVQLQQHMESMNTLINNLNEKVESNEIDSTLAGIYKELLQVIEDGKEGNGLPDSEDRMKKCEEIENRLSVISNSIESDYNKLSEDIRRLTSQS